MFIGAEIRLLRLYLLTGRINQKTKQANRPMISPPIVCASVAHFIQQRYSVLKVCVSACNNNSAIGASYHVKMHLILSHLSSSQQQQVLNATQLFWVVPAVVFSKVCNAAGAVMITETGLFGLAGVMAKFRLV